LRLHKWSRIIKDKQLLVRARKFDQDALSEIYDLYSTELYRYALNQLGDPSLAEDCVAETFSRFLRVLHKGKGPKDHMRGYLFQISRNWITDTYRRRGPDLVELKHNVQSATENNPDNMVELLLENAKVRQALLELLPDQRHVITLRYLEGWKTKEDANSMGKSIPAIKALQSRGIVALKKKLKSENENYE